MKRFTVKDFILATSPCFGCRGKLSYSIGCVDLRPEIILSSNYKTLLVLSDYSEMDLKISYNSGLKLKIYHKTNRFWTSDFKEFSKFLESHQLYLHTGCNKCQSQIDSQYLVFNLAKGFVLPVGISKEHISLLDNHNMYSIFNDTMRNETRVAIRVQDGLKSFSNPTFLKLPLLFLHKFKNKNQLIEKIKLYTLFS